MPRSFGSSPYAPSQLYDDSASASRITDIILSAGEARARAAERSGELWGGTVAGLGQMAGEAIQQYGEKQKAQAAAKAEGDFILAAQRDGFSFPKFLEMVPPESRGRVMELHSKLETSKAAREERLQKAERHDLESAKLKREAEDEDNYRNAIGAKELLDSLGTEAESGARLGVLGYFAQEKPDVIEQIRQLPGEQLRPVLERFIAGSPKFAQKMEEERIAREELKIKQTAETRQGAADIEARRHNLATEATARLTAAREAAPSFQTKEVLNDQGKPTLANFNSKTGQYIDATTGQAIKNPLPVPSATESAEARKFQNAAPVLKSMEELSEKINTLQGLKAKAVGEKAKLEAELNLNDNVAEYEALISGFTPLVARSLGHTGVLTEQDVQSVKALFPKPGDSKSLRDRKVARVKSIIGDLGGGTGTDTGWKAAGAFKIRPVGQ